jgi:hypothetical protein
MIQTEAPPGPPATLPAAAEVVVARADHSAVVASLDLPLTLLKAGRREDMLVRRALFLTAQATQVRPANGDGADRYRWKLAGYLQRQYCVQSLAGVFACTAPEVELLPDKAEGEASLANPGDFPLAQAAEQQLAESLKARADAMFAADRQTAVAPLLKAAGVTIAGAKPAKASPRRSAGRPAKGGPAARGGSAG